jgi:hypothetical protein
MQLVPVIASYSGASYRAIRAALTEPALSAVMRVAQGPLPSSALAPALIAMGVLAQSDDVLSLNTAVFLEADIEAINEACLHFGAALAEQVQTVAGPLRDAPPATRNLVIGIGGISQSLGHLLRDEGIADDWASRPGRYARAKVDFDEVCPAREALGPDLQTKTVLRGLRYTAVFIGPGGQSYPIPEPAPERWPGEGRYVAEVNAYLTDSLAALVAGERQDTSLQAVARAAGLLNDWGWDASVLTAEEAASYAPAMQEIGRITVSLHRNWLPRFTGLLQSTASGRQGVPPSRMMMHLWRYARRAVARELYAQGVFTDLVPKTGLITAFYENRVTEIDALFG